jgi:hypothetical protein
MIDKLYQMCHGLPITNENQELFSLAGSFTNAPLNDKDILLVDGPLKDSFLLLMGGGL